MINSQPPGCRRVRFPVLFGKVLVPLLASVVLVGACSPDGDPTEKPSASSSPTPVTTPTWSPQKPKKPESVNEQTKEGARNFALYYYRVFEYARHGEYWSSVKNLSTSDCHACNELTWGNEARKYRPEGPADLDPITIDLNGKQARVSVGRVAAAGTWQANLYEDPRRFAKQEWMDVLFLVYEDGQWLVDGIEIRRSDPVKDPTAPYRW